MQNFKSTLWQQELSADDLCCAEKEIICFSPWERFQNEMTTLTSGHSCKERQCHLQTWPSMWWWKSWRTSEQICSAWECKTHSHCNQGPACNHSYVIMFMNHLVMEGVIMCFHHCIEFTGSQRPASLWGRSLEDATDVNREKMGEQKMADLPPERTFPDFPSFTNVGVDFFGPIDVKRTQLWSTFYLFCKSWGSSWNGVLSWHWFLYKRNKKIHLQERTGFYS